MTQGEMGQPTRDTQDMSLGELLDTIYRKREVKEALSEKTKEINSDIDMLEYALLQRMDEQGLSRMECGLGSATRAVKLHPRIVDREAFLKTAFDNGQLELIQANVNAAAFRTYFEANAMYPDGVDAYEKASLNYRRSK